MTRQLEPAHNFVHTPGRASEHSTPFSDLRADADTRLLRLWLDNELEDHPLTWKFVDIARGGLSIVRKMKTAEYAPTDQNENLLKQLSLAAFALYQPDKLTVDGNLSAIPLARNTSFMLGRHPHSPFDAFQGSALSPNHLGLYVDDDDNLAIEAYDMDNMPQIEVIAADSETAVYTGFAARDYVRPRQIKKGSVATLPALSSSIHAMTPQFLSNIAIPVSELIEEPILTR